MYFETRDEAGPDGVVVYVSGEVDLATARCLANAIADGFRKDSRLILDLTCLSYIDGAGIRVLLATARAKRGQFVIVASGSDILRVFSVLHVNYEVPVVSSVSEGRELFRRAARSSLVSASPTGNEDG